MFSLSISRSLVFIQPFMAIQKANTAADVLEYIYNFNSLEKDIFTLENT